VFRGREAPGEKEIEMTYSNGKETVLGTADTVNFEGINWGVDAALDEMEFAPKRYFQLNVKCSECKREGNQQIWPVVTTVKQYRSNAPSGHLWSRCGMHQLRWEANAPRNGQRRISEVAPEDRTSEENEWMVAHGGARPVTAAPSFKELTCKSCFEIHAGECF
jgi:hypothetical protein